MGGTLGFAAGASSLAVLGTFAACACAGARQGGAEETKILT